MKKEIKVSVTALLFALLLFGCKNQSTTSSIEPPPSVHSGTAVASGSQGTVLQTLESGGYTYVELDTGAKTIWLAGPQDNVAVGDKLPVPVGAVPMHNFNSKTLDRIFEEIFFVGALRPASAMSAPAAQTAKPKAPSVESPKAGSIAKVEGGYTIEELFAKKDELRDKDVSVRAKIVKANFGIMKTNWYHIQDGTGEGGAIDFVITSNNQAKVGDIVVVESSLTLGKDFGAGYQYDIILEDANITVEK